ncbi:MAG: hypothetical protein P1U86_17525 [Verrucomicrobiales bacterium]|nr:hypothetical protein [Verrucomicrobiales bacterium]
MKSPQRLLRFTLLVTGSLLLFQSGMSGEANRLTPILAEPGDVFLADDFEEDYVVKKGHPIFKLGQGTTWESKDGLLIGTQSTPEYQAKKKAAGNGHLGTAPRLQFSGSPKDVIIKYSFKISGGKFTKLLPIIEAGHHLRRIYFGPDGSKILVDHEKTTIAESDFVLELDKWYHIMVEIKDNEFLVRFEDGPTIYGEDKGVGAEFANYNIGITATNLGTIYIDNMTIWKAGVEKSDWAEKRAALSSK